MSRLPDGTNPYGRFLDVMRKASSNTAGLIRGEYLGNGRFKVGDQTLAPGEYSLVQSHISIDGHTFSFPELSRQAHTVSRTVTHDHGRQDTFSFTVEVPGIAKGDRVIAYQFEDAGYVILGVIG